MKLRGCVLIISILIGITVLVMDSCDSAPKVQTLSATEVFAVVNDSIKVHEYVVLDLRQRLDYVRGHLVSAIWMPVDSLSRYLHLIKAEKRPIILYANDSTETARASKELLDNEIENVYVLEGGFSHWMKKGFPAAIQLVINTSDSVNIKAKNISANELMKIVNETDHEFAIIDLRPVSAFNEIHIKGALSIPYVPINEFVVKIEEQNFSRDKPLVVYTDSNSPDIGAKATDVLVRNLYTNVYTLTGGFEAWYRNDYPMAW